MVLKLKTTIQEVYDEAKGTLHKIYNSSISTSIDHQSSLMFHQSIHVLEALASLPSILVFAFVLSI